MTNDDTIDERVTRLEQEVRVRVRQLELERTMLLGYLCNALNLAPGSEDKIGHAVSMWARQRIELDAVEVDRVRPS